MMTKILPGGRQAATKLVPRVFRIETGGASLVNASSAWQDNSASSRIAIIVAGVFNYQTLDTRQPLLKHLEPGVNWSSIKSTTMHQHVEAQTGGESVEADY